MWSGVSALNNLDQALQSIRHDVVRLDTQLSQLTEQIGHNQRARVKIINDIAGVRLQAIDQNGLQQALTAADQQAKQLLEQREQALQQLNQQLEQCDQAIQDAEKARDVLLQNVNQSSQKIADTEASVQTELQQDQAYMAQFERAKQDSSVALEANQKEQQATQDLEDKAQPYSQDKLFMYLWQRHFGTTDYNGGLLTRWLDGWVAGLINYDEVRINYWNLQQIPQRLNEHAQRVAQKADESHMALQQLELGALKNAGAERLEKELSLLRDKLDQHDDDIEELEAKLNKQLQQRADFMAGEDQYIKACLEHLSQALQHRDLNAIHRYVRDTVSPTDDQLVIELQHLDDASSDVNEDLADVRALHDKRINKLKELEQVRRNFKNNRFDDVRSGFGNQALIAGVLNQFLQGMVNGGELWRVLQRNQRYRRSQQRSRSVPLPDFGSGGLGDLLGGVGRSRNSSWHWPKPRRGGGGFRIPSSRGRRSSGGFKTGGGF